MTDGCGRITDYLRLSVTDKCNLRCRYCMPCEVERLSHHDILSIEETSRICAILCDLGIRRIRITGGEPLVRKGITELVQRLSEIDSAPAIMMTTNGVLLADRIDSLIDAGLKSVNISLDTTDRNAYARLTGEDALQDVIAAVDAAYSSGMRVRINCVPIRGINDDELVKIAMFASDRAIDVRFIELMPIGCANAYEGISSEEVRSTLTKAFGEREWAAEGGTGEGPAVYYNLRGFCGRIGYISPMSHPFCSSCNRIRLTQTGQLKPCLYYPDSADLRKMIRGGCSDEDIKKAIMSCINNKPAEHGFGSSSPDHDNRQMFQIGG